MRVPNITIYALAWASVFLLYCTVKGADNCGSDKNAENQIVFNKSFAVNGDVLLFGKNKTPRMTCAWQITAPPGYIVVLSPSYLGAKEDLLRSKTVVFDGNSTDVVLWNSAEASFAGGFSLFSSSGHMRIVLTTGNNVESSLGSQYYSATVHVLPKSSNFCTNNRVFNFNASSAVAKFKSIYFPILYPPNIICSWKIQAPPGKFVRLQFTRPYKTNKQVQMYDGEELKENLLGEDVNFIVSSKEQGKKTVISSYFETFSTTQSLLIKFNSGSAPITRFFEGIIMEYSAVEPGCYGRNVSVVFNTFGNISTPGFPGNVPKHEMTCLWSFKAPVGNVVKLDLDTMNLESDSSCSKLRVKYLSVYKQRRFDSQYYCKNYVSRTLVSSGRQMTFMYTQPDVYRRKSLGIIAKYAAIPLVSTGICAANQSGTVNLKGEAATFHSLDYPKCHPGKIDCTWNIAVTAGQVIELRIDTNLGSDCNKEYIQIYDGPTKSSSVITKLCNKADSKKLYSSSNHLLIKFIGLNPSQGFIATYIARKAAPKPYACSSRSFHFNQTQGLLASWGFPLSYPNNVMCDWYIEVPPQHIVNLTLLFFDVQPDPSCSKDYVYLLEEVEAGEGWKKEKEIAKLCGTNLNQVSYQSTGRKMTVKFRSDSIGRYPGFEAKFEAVYKPPKDTTKKSKAVSTVAIVLIVIFSVLAVIGLTILIVWVVKYKYNCCGDPNQGKFDMVKLDDLDTVNI